MNTRTKKLIQKSIVAILFLQMRYVVAIPPPPDVPMPSNYTMECEVSGSYYSTGLSMQATGDQVDFHVFSPERPLQTNEKLMTSVSFSVPRKNCRVSVLDNEISICKLLPGEFLSLKAEFLFGTDDIGSKKYVEETKIEEAWIEVRRVSKITHSLYELAVGVTTAQSQWRPIFIHGFYPSLCKSSKVKL